jgi:hypothetical protein
MRLMGCLMIVRVPTLAPNLTGPGFGFSSKRPSVPRGGVGFDGVLLSATCEKAERVGATCRGFDSLHPLQSALVSVGDPRCGIEKRRDAGPGSEYDVAIGRGSLATSGPIDL